MRIYRVKIQADKYPTEYNVNASNWATAIARAVREWSKRFKGSRATELKIIGIKSTALLTDDNTKDDE